MALTLAPHPRLLLTPQRLAKMQAEYQANSKVWQDVLATADSMTGGVVNYPNQAQYPDSPDIGSGYQGENYLYYMLSTAAVYLTLKDLDPTRAAPYLQKGIDILMKAAEPYPGNGQDPFYDYGYGIRNYGPIFGLGYDWFYDALTAAQKTTIITTANAWCQTFETKSFEFDFPQGNYMAGYMHGKCAITLATYEDNPNGATMWDAWLNAQWYGRIQPYYAQYLAGGDWPEGFGNYGPPALRNLAMAMWEVETATGINLRDDAKPFPFITDNALYLMHFTWPGLWYMDDRDLSHSTGNPMRMPCASNYSLHSLMALALEDAGSPLAPVSRAYREAVSTVAGVAYDSPWHGMLLAPMGTTTSPYQSALPLSYYASGMGAVAARSDWTRNARWMSIRGAPYVNNPNASEEMYDQGGLVLTKGSQPLLVNGWGWMVNEPGGDQAEGLLLNDILDQSISTMSPFLGNRQVFNVFYVRNMAADGVTPLEHYGQGSYLATDGAKTKTTYLDDGRYVYTNSTRLQDMYRPFAAGAPLLNWQREVIYVRPNRFVVFDRTQIAKTTYDQYMGWHFPGNPVVNGLVHAITYNGQNVGAMTLAYPPTSTTVTVPQYPTSDPVKVWQVQLRAGNTNTTQEWLTLFDMAPTPATIAMLTSAAKVARIDGSDGTTVVAFTDDATGVQYDNPQVDALHVIAGLTAGSGYAVTLSPTTVTIAAGSAYTATSEGTLSFEVKGGVLGVPADYDGQDGHYDDATPQRYAPAVDPNNQQGGGGGTTTPPTNEVEEMWNVTGGNGYVSLPQALAEATTLAMLTPGKAIMVNQPDLTISYDTTSKKMTTSTGPTNTTVTIPAFTGDPTTLNVSVFPSPYYVVDGLGGYPTADAAVEAAIPHLLGAPGSSAVIHGPLYSVVAAPKV